MTSADEILKQGSKGPALSHFTKVKIPDFDNKPVHFDNNIDYPQSKNGNLPKNFYTALIIGGTGTGKTFACCKLLKYYERFKIYNSKGQIVPQRIILMSPSIKSNPIFNSLKNLDDSDKITNYSDSKLQEVLDDIEQVKQDAIKYQKDYSLYEKFTKIKSLSELSIDELLSLYSFNFEEPEQPRFVIPPCNFLILDDLLNSDAYKSTGKSLINNLAVRNRHLGINLFILAQSAPQIPKCIRSQARLLFLYRYNSKNIIEDLFEIVSNVLTPEQFKEIYLNATSNKWNFLTIDNTGKDLVFKQNLDHLIMLNNP